MMKHISFSLLCVLFVGWTPIVPLMDSSTVHAEQTNPSYVKWARIAVDETKEKYPNARMKDFLHLGKETQGDNTIEKFKLSMQEGDKSFILYVNVAYNTKGNTLNEVTFEEEQ
ncbi:DUF3889 domain-containing protein [Pontibacillus salicampi]|uniref:DUF3889 domain-containing protein n=1 Tax=Pontibacillus salicampi TaxID=1449801 RepID=A0ABV6LPS5_9BACI